MVVILRFVAPHQALPGEAEAAGGSTAAGLEMSSRRTGLFVGAC
jgi:hypothetical protein